MSRLIVNEISVTEIAHKSGTGNITIPTGSNIVGGAGASLISPGSVIQTVYATSGFVNQTITSATPVALTGMTATITPKLSTSRILLQAMVTASWSYVASIHIYRNGVDVIPNHGGNNQSGGATAFYTHYQSSQESARSNQVFSFPVIYQENANGTDPLTYSLWANAGWSGGSEAFYLNNRNSVDMLGCSTMLLMEIAA
jgi:hypothetical protein